MKCPHCKAFGPRRDELEEHWEPRGQLEGKPVRRCRSCGGGFYLRRFGAPRAIEDSVWLEMERAWERGHPEGETEVNHEGARTALGSESDVLSKEIHRGLAAEMADKLGSRLEELDQDQLYFIAGRLEGIAIFQRAASEQEAQALPRRLVLRTPNRDIGRCCAR